MKFETKVILAGQEPDPQTGAVMTPIYATATYAQSSPGAHKGYDYARTRNPTRDALEACLAELEGGHAGFAFASGMAAIGTVLELLDAGSHVVAMHDLYGGSYRIFETLSKRSAGLQASFVDLSRTEELGKAIRANTQVRWVESPTNPRVKRVDPPAVGAIARKGGLERSRRFLERCKLFTLAESLGGVESLIEHPAIMTHASLPEDVRAELGIDEGLVRLSVGIENVDDLVAELKYALE